jgi:pyrimidine operon attenuation protein/uracil phosphoribosyltransferase
MSDRIVILNSSAVHRVLTRIGHEIAERNDDSHAIGIVGVQTGGVHLARRLGQVLAGIWGHPVPIGTLDVSMHRDDLAQHAAPTVHATDIPFDVNAKTVVLVDDVLFSGRTIRASLDALNDFGRPARIQLAVLVDRGHRELPIKADFVGKNVPTGLNERIDVRLKEDHGEDLVYFDKG